MPSDDLLHSIDTTVRQLARDQATLATDVARGFQENRDEHKVLLAQSHAPGTCKFAQAAKEKQVVTNVVRSAGLRLWHLLLALGTVLASVLSSRWVKGLVLASALLAGCAPSDPSGCASCGGSSCDIGPGWKRLEDLEPNELMQYWLRPPCRPGEFGVYPDANEYR
jgi:hypothetical protein